MRRIRYNRGDIASTMRAAISLSHSNQYIIYVFGSALGYTISQSPPPFNQDYYKVRPDGTSTLVQHEFKS